MAAENRASSLVFQIDQLLEEVSQLAKKETDPRAFMATLLQRAVLAVEAQAAAIWMTGPDSSPISVSSYKVEQMFGPDSKFASRADKATQAISQMVATSIETGKPKTLNAQAKSGQSAALSVYVWPFKSDDNLDDASKFDRAVAIYFDSKVDPELSQVYLSFAEAIAEIAADFQTLQDGKARSNDQASWNRFKAFSDGLHQSLNVRSTAESLVNLGRSYYDCDRVLVARRSGGSYKLIAATGAAAINRKSKTVKAIETLTSKAFYRNDKPIVFHGSEQAPSKLASAFARYQEVSGNEFLMLAPVKDRRGKIRFVQVIECGSPGDVGALVKRVTSAETQTRNSLCNALQHEAIPMRGLLSTLGGTTGALGLRKLAIPLALLGIVGLAIAAMLFLKTEMTISADGAVVPETQRIVFATKDGVIDDLYVADGDQVEMDQPLVELRSVELEMQISLIQGNVETEKKKLDAIEVIKTGIDRGTKDGLRDLAKLSGDELEAKQRIKNLEQQLDAFVGETKRLEINSPIAGQVVIWDAEVRLRNRPVSQGDALLRVVSTEGKWLAKIRVPDHRMSHLLGADETGIGSEQKVELVIATRPAEKFVGVVRNIANSADVDPATQESFVVVTIEIQAEDLEGLQPGSSVMAKFECGQVSYGYSWFNEFIDSIRYRFF